MPTLTKDAHGAEMLRLPADLPHFTDDQYFQFCSVNRDLRIERSAEGAIIIMSPTGGETGRRNLEISRQLGNWARQNGSGVAFDSSTEFRLPNGANRSPDVSWVPKSRWEALAESEREKFPPLCPDFVLELLSPSDNRKQAQFKMEEYLANGARLGWLIDPKNRRVLVYTSAGVEVLDAPGALSGDPVLPGFTLDLSEVFS